jgi:oxygen-independent coproporphyrinogen-3 oxidase
MFPAQKGFEAHLPNEKEKRSLYEFGKKLLIEMGYEEVGMDHFALTDDPLCAAKRNGNLHRNFMGYTTSPSEMLIGLGASSISDIGLGFAQNEKNIESYQDLTRENQLPIIRGHVQTKEDQIIRTLILDLICRGNAQIPEMVWKKTPAKNQQNLQEMADEELLAQRLQWLDKLGQERRLSDNTVEAYERDTRQFLHFLTGHCGGSPGISDIANLRPADLRGFLAARRNAGAGARTLGRGLAGIRSLLRSPFS